MNNNIINENNFFKELKKNNKYKQFINIVQNENWDQYIQFSITDFYNLIRKNKNINFFDEWIHILKLIWNILVNHINKLRKNKNDLSKINNSIIIERIEDIKIFFNNIITNIIENKKIIINSNEKFEKTNLIFLLYKNIDSYILKESILITYWKLVITQKKLFSQVYNDIWKNLEYFTVWEISKKWYNENILKKIKQKLYYSKTIPTIKYKIIWTEYFVPIVENINYLWENIDNFSFFNKTKNLYKKIHSISFFHDKSWIVDIKYEYCTLSWNDYINIKLLWDDYENQNVKTKEEKNFKFIREKIINWWYLSTAKNKKNEVIQTTIFPINVYNIFEKSWLNKIIKDTISNIKNNTLNWIWYENNNFLWKEEFLYINMEEWNKISKLIINMLKNDNKLKEKFKDLLFSELIKDFISKIQYLLNYIEEIKNKIVNVEDYKISIQKYINKFVTFEYIILDEDIYKEEYKQYIYNIFVAEYKKWNKELTKEIMKIWNIYKKYWLNQTDEKWILNILENWIDISENLFNYTWWYFNIIKRIYIYLLTDDILYTQNKIKEKIDENNNTIYKISNNSFLKSFLVKDLIKPKQNIHSSEEMRLLWICII